MSQRKSIKLNTQNQLWGLSAGRCELCNKLLSSSEHDKTNGNYGEIAHIHAVNEGGARYNDQLSEDDVNDISNLMLLCSEDHHMIDTKPELYTVGYLKSRKKEHEDRINAVSEIGTDQSCSIVTYFSDITKAKMAVSDELLKEAVLAAKMYPKQNHPIQLHEDSRTGVSTSIMEKAIDLDRQFKTSFNDIVKPSDAVSIFAIAAQPLLIKLGTLINDQYNVSVFQHHRVGHMWAWPDDITDVSFVRQDPDVKEAKSVALVLDLSAVVGNDRIVEVLGPECAIYHLTIDNPNPEFVKNIKIQSAFSQKLRETLDYLKNKHPDIQQLHVFPVMPNSLAILSGIRYMPKADISWVIYDQENPGEGFHEALRIGG